MFLDEPFRLNDVLDLFQLLLNVVFVHISHELLSHLINARKHNVHVFFFLILYEKVLGKSAEYYAVIILQRVLYLILLLGRIVDYLRRQWFLSGQLKLVEVYERRHVVIFIRMGQHLLTGIRVENIGGVIIRIRRWLEIDIWIVLRLDILFLTLFLFFLFIVMLYLILLFLSLESFHNSLLHFFSPQFCLTFL